MARKYDFISELYNRTCKTVVANPASWEAFLRSACYNYRLRFDEQLLVHAQRPDATAVLQIDDWNKKFGRWVNRGAHGIAVFEDADQRRQRLVHYFDISDTHPSRFSRRVPIWQMRDEYTAEVIDTLESTFGELDDKETLAVAIESAARNAVEDNIPDYLTDLLYSVEDSFLDGVSEEEITHIFKTAVRNSIAYMMMTRLGIDAGEYFEPDDLRDVVNFTTSATLNALGYATSDIAEMGLSEISRTILALDRQNRIIADSRSADYNKENKTERSPDDERDHLHDAGRLSASQSDYAGAAGAVDGQIRPDAEEVPQGASQGTLLQPADELHPERAPERHGAQSDRAGAEAGGADGSVGGRDGEPESDGYDELGSEDEQHPEPGAGDRYGGGNLRLDYYDRSHEDKSLPFFGGDDTVREILGTTPHLKASKDEIRAFFEATADEDARISYIKRIFNNDFTEVILSDGRRVGYKTYQNVLQLWEGSYLSRTAQSFYDWGVIAQHFEAMRLLGELYDTAKPLPSIDGQLSLMMEGAEEQNPSAFTFSQEIIDAVLTRGSGISEGKMRIYEQFQRSLSAKENADFLKEEYGWGGAYPVIAGTGIDEQHDGKGIRISKGIGNDKPHIDLKWSQVEKRIAELIRLDRYLNPKEMAQYPEWLKQQEERRAELAEERKNREILSTAPSEKEEPKNERYEYHLGSTVYLGANEYEILSFDDERVMLYDTQFPLFNKEMTRAEFDSKVQENPLNDHLKVAKKQPEEKAVEYDIGMGYLGNGLTVWNRAVEVNGDYQNIAHISPEGEITFYVQDLPQSVVERIRQVAEREKPKDAALPEFYQAYLKTKADNPSSLLLYQVGDFFEAYADDAEVIGTALDLVQTTRVVDHNTRVPMVGFPQNRLETYLTMLTDRGYDVTINAVEDSERIIRTVVSTTKEAPVESKPIGRIDYLGTDGKVGESIEYTSPYSFEKDIKEENYYGVPMSIVLYKDKDGNTIPHGFIAQLDPPPKGFEIIDSPYLPENALDKAKHLIDDFCREEYQREDGADYTDLTDVGVAYTTTEDDKHEIQARVNLVDFRIETLADGKVIRSEQYSSIEELTEKGLQTLSFDDLVYLSEEELAQVEAPLTPVWEHPKKSRVQTFDIHPEIPMADRHTFDLAAHEVTEVNKKERFHRNYAAIITLRKCREENRFATPDEQIILSKYVGWGGIPEAFDERAGSWQTEFGMLKNILTPEEYASARESTLTAFYTPPAVINAVYKVMKQLGFREGNILEPSCGIGHFIGMLPEEMKESKIYGVELDTVSAGIAQQLYQKSSIAAQGFEETNLPDSFFDAVVGNVPFGDFKVPDKRYDKHKFLIHDFFFAKSLDKLRPGGVMALITSKGTMDKENSAVRKYIAQRADLLGAIRLPNNTFKGNAGTEVVSDILILQKRDRIVDIEPDWVQLGTDENDILMNRYFVEHPEMILGEMKMVSGRFGPEATCVPYEGADLAEQLGEAVSNIHGELTAYEVEDELAEEDNSIPADPTVRNFSYTVLDDKIYFRENSRMAPVEVSATAENRIKGMIRIRDSVRKLIELQTEDYPDSEIKAEQERLNALYDTFSKQYGLINSRANISAFSQDSSFSLLSALEVLGDEGQLERKADIFYKRTIKPHTPVTSVDTASEALAVSMGEKARVDMDYIPMSIERQRAILEQQLDEVTEGIAELKKNRGDNFSVKQLERTKKSVKQKLDKLNDQSKKDDTVTFEELGVDRLFIDESHYYKNLFLFTKMRNVGGIAQTEAMKSSDLFMKCRYLDELTGGRGTVFATGTPISNSMVELYTIQRYLQYNTLVQNNLQHFDAWASTFGETITAVELTPEGTGYRAKTRFARFYNLPELMAMFKEIADIKTADMLDLPVPKAVFHNISVKPSEIQKQMVAELAERAERVRNGMVDAKEDNMLKITNDGRKLALDQRLINPLLPDFEDSKLNACVDAMFETWERGSEKRLTQLFFCDLSTPKNDGSFNVYDDIRQKLIARGVPADEIRFIHEADTEAKKLELFKKVRRGDVRILMGSTQKMGAGTNVQNKLAASSDLDCPWRPSDLEQRLGRSIRQGNENAEVHIYRFVTEETFDAYLYQLVEGKQKFASQIMTSKSPVRSCEDIDETALSYAEIKMLATGNPHIKEKMDLDIQVQKLRLLKSNFLSEKYALEDKIIKFYPQEIARRTDVIAGLKSDMERVAEHPKPSDETFVGMTVKGAFYSEKADAGNAILEACKAMTNPEPIPLGEYRGFTMDLYFEAREYKVRLKGELGYPVPLGTDTFGNITRLDNALEGLPKRLEMNGMELDNLKKQFETAKVDVERPFPQEEELKTKTARLNELNALLNVDKRENEIVGGEPDEGEELPEKKTRDLER